MQTGILAKLQRYSTQPRGQLVIIILILAFSLLVRLLLMQIQGCRIDEGCFVFWFIDAANNGVSGFFDRGFFCDYPPFNVYIFYIFGKLGNAVGPENMPYITKLPGNLFDIATAFLLFYFVRQRFSFKVALAVMTLYAFNPATIFNLAIWGQMDSIYTFFMIASLYSALRSKHEMSGALLCLAILTKPQGVVLLPVVAYIILRNGGWRRALSSSAAFGILVFLLILPFNWDNPVAFLVDRYSGYNLYPFNSINAYNIWALLGFWKSDVVSHAGLTYQQWGILAFVAFTAFVMWQLHKRYEPRSAIFAVFLLMFGFFMLMTRMHERYLFPVFALLALGWYTRFTIWIYLGLTITYFAQVAYVLSVLNAEKFISSDHWSIYVLSTANIILFGLSIWAFYRTQRSRPTEVEARPPPQIPLPAETEEQPVPSVRKESRFWNAQVGVIVLCVIFFATSVWNLGDLRVPRSDFVPVNDPVDLYIDIGETARVDTVYFLVQDATNVDVDVYWGSPDSWKYHTNFSKNGVWQNWEDVHLGQETRYVRLVFKGRSGRIGEIALFSGGERLDVSGIVEEDDQGLGTALIDEQSLVIQPASHKSGTYFDEIYYVRAAEEHLKLEYPAGERTHPPMSKLLIAAGIKIFGHNPFAWRIVGVILATLMIPLIFSFAGRMFHSSRAGLIAAFLLTFDFMHFAEARIATPETYILFFVMFMFYFFYRYWQDPEHNGRFLFLSLVFFGLGFATKWVVMWGFIGLIILLLIRKWRKPILRNEVYWFAGGIGAAVSIYMLSWIPYFLAGYGLGDWWDYHWFMFEFHSGLEATHPFSSEWWTWPLMLRPLWLYVGYFSDATSYIATLGNPALWWAGILAIIAILPRLWWFFIPFPRLREMLMTLWWSVKYYSPTAAFILIPFLTQWLIFALIGRVLFIYHFYPNVLFIILACTLLMNWLWCRYRWGKWAVAGYLVLNVVCFILFFPVISGLAMTEGYWDALRWMVSWVT